eukprot:NODE_498_length_6794_cov_0.318250.p1 type:complete len:396 gc:universal NODE_498_length_6794_cov_0.318250:107-1294(+)
MTDPILRFQQYLQIKTVQPNPDYQKCASFLKQQASDIGLDYKVMELVKNKPIILLIWPGQVKQSIIFNSHTDVVPVSEEHWSFPPFDATISNNKIYARGSQDMKCVGMQYLEAIRLLKDKITPYFTWIFSFVPDEEIGGHDGMELFVTKPEFKALQPIFAFDEGLASKEDHYKLYYGERAPFWIKLIARGTAGHGSLLLENTANIKLLKVLNKVSEFRDQQCEKQRNGFKIGELTSANITMLESGKQVNVIPDTASASVDIRVTPFMSFTEMEQLITNWCSDTVSFQFIQKFDNQNVTKLEDNPFYNAILETGKQVGISIDNNIFPGATDSRYLRRAGIPAFGISPIRNTPVLLHAHDEYLTVDGYMEGITFYQVLFNELNKIRNVPEALLHTLK